MMTMMRPLVLAGLAGALFSFSVLEPAAAQDSARSEARYRQIQNRLAATKISFEFEETSLEDAISFVAKLTRVNLVISPRLRNEGVEDLTLTLKLRDVSAKTALDLILRFHDLGMTYRSGVLLITTKEDARGRPILRLYSIADLTFKLEDFPAPDLNLRPSSFDPFAQEEPLEREGAFEDPEVIIEILQSNVMPESWDDERVSISATKRVLIVRQSREAHAQIAKLLGLLRAHK